MHRWVLLLAAVALAATAAVAFAADRTATLGDAARSYGWEGPKATANSLAYAIDAGEPCVKNEVVFCDSTLLNVDLPPDNTARLTITIPATGADDFDLHVYESDADGGPGLLVASSAHDAPNREIVTIFRPSGWFQVKVVYYDVDDAGYTGEAVLNGLPEPEPTATATPTPTATATPTPTATATPAATPTPEAAPRVEEAKPGTVTPSSATPAAAAPPATRLWIARRTSRRVVARLLCAEPCRAVVEARWRKRVRRARIGVDAGDTRELSLRAPRRARLRAVVRPRRGGEPTVLRAAP